MNDAFRKIAAKTSYLAGTAWAFLLALTIIMVWALTGPLFAFSTTWQLVINTGTTIMTFLMVFLIQNTQNRDSKAIHIKLDELLKAQKGARTSLVNLEELPDNVLEELESEFRTLQTRYAHKLRSLTGEKQKHHAQVIDFLKNISAMVHPK